MSKIDQNEQPFLSGQCCRRCRPCRCLRLLSCSHSQGPRSPHHGSRIYDSNCKTCHQCGQKTMDFAASCTMLRRGDKLYAIKLCYKCILNRYGEKVEEVYASGSWICSKCWGICNYSFCMKRKGL